MAHTRPVFPSEPRLLLARGIVEEQFNGPADAYVRGETAASLHRGREGAARADLAGYEEETRSAVASSRVASMLPRGIVRRVGRWLLGHPSFTRHIVLDRWFLRTT